MKSGLRFITVLLVLCIGMTNNKAFAQALSGTKTVGTGGDYTTLTAAIADVNTKGVNGSLVLLINNDLTEPGSIEVTSTTLTGGNKLTIKPNTGKQPIITFTACATSGNKGNAGFTISGMATNVGNITIDGSNTQNGVTRDMTFSLNDTTNGRFAIKLNGETDNLVFKNLKVLATGIKPTTSSGSRTYGFNCIASATAAADSLIIANCEIGSSSSAFYYGIYKPDGGTVPYGSALNISGNKIYAQHKGMSIWGSDGVSNINDNQISVIGHPTGAYVQNSINGIYVETWKGTLNVFNNKIISIYGKALNQTALKPMYGLLVYYATGTGVTGQTANVYNNFISDFGYTADATTQASEIDGLALDAVDQNINVYYNSIYINKTNININPASGIRVYDDAGMQVNLKNNIICNNVNHDSSYAIYASPVANNCLKTSDYNDLCVTGASAYVGLYNAVKQKTLNNWQTSAAKDINSINVNPALPFGAAGQFVSPQDLHWVSKPSISFAGTPISGYTKDIDGDVRNTTKPYMGADEGPAFVGVVDGKNSSPVSFNLSQNYPNPFNPTTSIEYSLNQNAFVTISIYNSLGEKVMQFIPGNKIAGRYTQIVNAQNLSSGVYYYELRAGESMQIKKMVLMK
ncbi:MAG: T9SS type A sorting domain-containing protein [Ignavibacteria bacterium]|nr:T9SS type A sorting domain-containing protein [Ignavibacteria bacterium]